MIDFSPVDKGELTLYELAQALRLTAADLRAATHASLDTLLAIIGDAGDAQLTHIPYDPEANDPYAPPEFQHVGWSLAHLVAHVTATSEEAAAIASILARGIPYTREPRLRYETEWQTITTRAQVVQRIAESRRIRAAYLDTFPDAPHLDVFRDTSERFAERHGKLNAIAQFLYGLKHELGHHDQFREAARQAREMSLSAAK
jgi:hypothetical protein